MGTNPPNRHPPFPPPDTSTQSASISPSDVAPPSAGIPWGPGFFGGGGHRKGEISHEGELWEI